MTNAKHFYLAIICLLYSTIGQSQAIKDADYVRTVLGVKLSLANNPLQYPIINLGSTASMSLVFDDAEPSVKTYNYTFQLCDADWQPVNMSAFDYLQGFTQNRIKTYTRSSIAKVQYMHYAISLPEVSMTPSKSGNYILKVFMNGDTSQLVFTRRFLVLDDKVPVAAQVQQTFDSQKMQTHQKVQFSIDVNNVNALNPQQQIKVVVVQNNRWDNAITGKQPSFIKNTIYEYNGERDFLFPGGKEYRWIDLTSFRFFSDRVANIDRNLFPFRVQAVPDRQRLDLAYMPYQDYDGAFFYKAAEDIDVNYQGDYARVFFRFYTKDTSELNNQNIYIVGQFNNYNCDDKSVLQYNKQTGMYENTQLLKQGYYTYMYVTQPQSGGNSSDALTEGDFWQTENNYTIFVYYRSLNNRYDELVAAQTINSRINSGIIQQ